MARRNVQKSPKLQAKTIDAFLEAYEKVGTIRGAAKIIRLNHANHYRWLGIVDGYAARFAEVHERTIEKLGPKAEAEFVSRAIDGVRTLVIDKGVPVEVWVNPDGEIVPSPKDPEKPGGLKRVLYWETKKSDTLLIKLLQRLYPEQYGDKQKVSLQGAVTHTHDVTEDVKKILADPDATRLANDLARRMAINAGGNGESTN